MAEACLEVGASLIGGETAEMPGVYNDEEIDLVGSVVGLVDQEKKLPRGKMQPGDAVIGIASNASIPMVTHWLGGLCLRLAGCRCATTMPNLGRTIGAEDASAASVLFQRGSPNLAGHRAGICGAHITGGGLYDNIPRVMPSGRFGWSSRSGLDAITDFPDDSNHRDIPEPEMYRAFNMGTEWS